MRGKNCARFWKIITIEKEVRTQHHAKGTTRGITANGGIYMFLINMLRSSTAWPETPAVAPFAGVFDGPKPHQNKPRQGNAHGDSMEDKNISPPTDPPIYKYLNAKTQGLLRQSNRVQQEQKQTATMSNEQT